MPAAEDEPTTAATLAADEGAVLDEERAKHAARCGACCDRRTQWKCMHDCACNWLRGRYLNAPHSHNTAVQH